MPNETGDRNRLHRRSMIAGVGAILMTSLSGCLHGDGESAGDGESSGDDQGDEEPAGDGDAPADDDADSSNSADPDVEIVAGYPDDSGELVTEVLLEPHDFASIGSATTSDKGVPYVPVELTSEAADRFATFVVDAGFTDEGVNACTFEADEHDEPQEGEYCLYTVLDGEYVYGASMSRDLADSITTDREGFVESGEFVLNTGSIKEAEELEAALRE